MNLLCVIGAFLPAQHLRRLAGLPYRVAPARGILQPYGSQNSDGRYRDVQAGNAFHLTSYHELNYDGQRLELQAITHDARRNYLRSVHGPQQEFERLTG